MAESSLTLNAGSGGASLATMTDGTSLHHQKVVIELDTGTDPAPVNNSNPVPVSDAGGSLTVDGTVTVSDGGGSVTVDNAALSVTGGGVEASALRVTIANDSTGVVSIDDNGSTLSVDDGGGSLTVDGTVAISGTVAVTDNSGSLTVDNAALSVVGGGLEATALRVTLASDSTGVLSVDDNGGSLTVDGTVAATQSGTWSVRLTDGTDTADVLDLTNSNPLTVAIVDGSGTQITSFGGGTQYTEGDVDASITGTAIMFEGTSNTLNSVSAAVPLPVTIISGAGSGGTASADDADFTAGTTNGTPAMGVYQSTPTAVTDGDMGIVGITANRELKVSVTSGAVGAHTDDAAFTPASGEGVVIMAMADETTPDSVDEGDAGAVRMTLARALHVNLRDDAGDSAMDGTNNAVRVNVVAGSTAGTEATHDSAAASAGPQIMGVGSATTPTAVSANGDAVRVWCTTSGAVNVADGGGTLSIDDGAGSITVDGTVAVSGTVAVTDNSGSLTVDAPVGTPVFVRLSDGSAAISTLPVSLASVPSHAVTNAGTFAVQVDGAALTALQLIDNSAVTDDAAFTAATTGVNVAGFVADETATDSVDEGDAGAARMTLDRKQIVTPYVHAAAGGQTPYYNLDVDETEDAVKASAGKVYWLHAINRSTGVRYLKFYDATVATVVVGTTTPVLVLPLPTPGDTNGAGFTIHFGDAGVQFGTAITIAATTGFADSDTGAPGTNDVIVSLGYS